MPTLHAKKSLGQNFLVDEKARGRIASAAGIVSGETVVEIGPGTGLLTTELLTFPLAKLIAFEIDNRAISLLQSEINDARFEVRNQDILGADLHGLAMEIGSKVKLVGNIPYYITSPILFKLMDDRDAISSALLLVQFEVAERLSAVPRTKAYGIPTVLANFFGEVKFLFKVKAGSFNPVPNVDSALVRIDFGQDYFTRSQTSAPQHFDSKTFQRFVRTMFAMRRKMLRNNLKAFLSAEEYVASCQSEAVMNYLQRRAEELDVREFVHFFSEVELTRAVKS
ncbi:MAG: 16S rRNA (adenine(1518)-N(6)/adenine(1519)-N(6))-dimethyltransferase RsmA [bacterium]